MNNIWKNKKFRSLVLVTVSGVGVFSGINLYKGNEKFYKNVIMPVVHILEPETAHRLAIEASKYRLIPKSRYKDADILKIELFGRKLSNPIGLAAGFDKHAEAIMGLRDLGFGFVEIGSVTPLPQPGNDKPRVFRLTEDKAVINRYGFNSHGHDEVYQRLENLRYKDNCNYTVGVNLGKNKTSIEPIQDYVQGLLKFEQVSDYLVINISSPNTPGLRSMQTKVALQALLSELVKTKENLKSESKPRILLKLAPDLSHQELREIAEVLQLKSCKIDGLIISNTTVDRPESLLNEVRKKEVGGLSGKPLKDRSTQMIADMYKLTNGMTIIGVGGVFTGQDAYDKIKAGASAIQIYTSFIYDGPPVVSKIKKELTELLIADGYNNISEAVGKGVH